MTIGRDFGPPGAATNAAGPTTCTSTRSCRGGATACRSAINLNPDKDCNFDCIYCQVDRTVPPCVRTVDLDRLATELDLVLHRGTRRLALRRLRLSALPPGRRDVRDIAFSGDGEPTTCPVFEDAVRIAVAAAAPLRSRRPPKIVLITDAAYLNEAGRCARRSACSTRTTARSGRSWTPAPRSSSSGSTGRTSRSGWCSRTSATRPAPRPIVIQSLWMRIDAEGPPAAEIEAYCERVNEVAGGGGPHQGDPALHHRPNACR